MVAVVRVPDLGGEMVGGVVAEWYRADGAEVAEGEPVCRLECDFIAFEIEASATGVLRHRRPAGSIERKGAVLGLVIARGEPMPPEEAVRAIEAASLERAARAKPASPPAAPAPPPVPRPASGVEAVGHEAERECPPVVVPFRRAAGEDEPRGHVPAGERAEPLPEPGGEIPGLPLWKDDETAARAPNEEPPAGPAPVADAPPADADPRVERFGRIAREAAASAEVLSACARVNWSRAREAVAALAEEWAPFGPKPMVEDVAVRAIARALAEHGVDAGPAGLVVVEPGSDCSYAVEEPLASEFRQVIQGRAAGDASFERAGWMVVSLMQLGIERIEPRLAGGRLAFGLGADANGEGTITMRFESTMLGEGDAGRVLARVRTLVENPYRLWA